jgi:hypothetical protein
MAAVRPFYKSKSDWQHIIDSTWGPGLPLANKLAIFDTYADTLTRSFDGFLSLGLNWDSLRTHYRSKIDSTTSRGRFAAIMARFAVSLRDAHTVALDTIVTFTPLAPGVPLLVLSPFSTAEHFGAVLTALPDSSALVLRTVANHPLGLVPGDVVLGYEGVPWKRLVKELLDAELPMFCDGVGASSAETHALLRNVGNNWHLFETIDILKYSTKDTLHLSVSPLLGLSPELMLGNEQLEIPDIPFAQYIPMSGGGDAGQELSYGKLPGANIGYIQLVSEHLAEPVESAFFKAIDALWNTEGLVIDMRWNEGGWAMFDQAFAMMFSQHIITIEDAYRAGPTTFNLVASNHSSWFDIPGEPESIYDRPIAVLLGPTCVSMGDVTAQRLRYHPMVRFFGKPPIASLGDNKMLGYKDWYLRYSISDMFHVNQPGVYLNRREFPIDEPVWFNPDDVAQGKDPVLIRAQDWIKSLAYFHDFTGVNPYVRPGTDTLVVTSILNNPAMHDMSARVTVSNAAAIVLDSAVMMNDGLHGDGLPGDSVWGAHLRAFSTEDFYTFDQTIWDNSTSSTRRLVALMLFTTAGPMICVGDTSDKKPVWGESIRFKFKVRHTGKTALVNALKGHIRSLDTVATITFGTLFDIGDFSPGQERLSSYARISFSQWSAGKRDIPFEISFSSSSFEYWRDTILITVDNPTGVDRHETVPLKFALEQNYPNPFNPTTTIEYQIPSQSLVTLKIFDLLGREVAVLVNEKKDAGNYSVRWNASGFATGMYLVRIQAGSFIDTKKVLLMK